MIKISYFSKLLKKLLKILENRIGLVILAIFVIAIVYTSWIFYNFIYKSISASPQASFQKTEIKKAAFNRIMEQMELRKQNILEATEKEYKDIFK